MTIGVPRETFAGEKRVATVPDVVEKLVKLGFGVNVETGAGAAANFDDAAYEAAGARIAAGAAELYAGSDLIFKVRAPTPERDRADEAGQHARRASSGRRRTPSSCRRSPRAS